MDNTLKLRPPTDEELRELLKGILQENRDHGHIKPRRIKCNDCRLRTTGTAKCSKYPEGIPNRILTDEEICPSFEQK